MKRRAKNAWVAFGWPRKFHLVRYFGANVRDVLSELAEGFGFEATTACLRRLTSTTLVESGQKVPSRQCRRCRAALRKAKGKR